MRDLNAQTFGSVAVIGTFACAEIAALMLTRYPQATWLWYLNLDVFIDFEHARTVSSSIRWLFGEFSLAVWLICLTATIVVRFYELRLAAAMITNICFACITGLLLESHRETSIDLKFSSQILDLFSNISVFLTTIVFLASLVAFVTSHVCFIRRVIADIASRAIDEGCGAAVSPA